MPAPEGQPDSILLKYGAQDSSFREIRDGAADDVIWLVPITKPRSKKQLGLLQWQPALSAK